MYIAVLQHAFKNTSLTMFHFMAWSLNCIKACFIPILLIPYTQVI